MDLKERLNRTKELWWIWSASKLPDSLAYWSFIHSGVRTIDPDEIIPDVTYMTLLERLGDRYYDKRDKHGTVMESTQAG